MLKEVVDYMITVCIVFESVRRKFSKYNEADLLQAQEYLVAAIESLKKGVNSVSAGITTEARKFEEAEQEEIHERNRQAIEAAKAEALKQERIRKNRGK